MIEEEEEEATAGKVRAKWGHAKRPTQMGSGGVSSRSPLRWAETLGGGGCDSNGGRACRHSGAAGSPFQKRAMVVNDVEKVKVATKVKMVNTATRPTDVDRQRSKPLSMRASRCGRLGARKKNWRMM